MFHAIFPQNPIYFIILSFSVQITVMLFIKCALKIYIINPLVQTLRIPTYNNFLF